MYSIEEFDKQKTRVLKYIMYQKRTKKQIIQKFSKDIDDNILEDVIAYLEEAGYINDIEYIGKAIKQYILLNTLSIKEIKYKLMQKGLNANNIDDYICENIDELEEYEASSAKKILLKKSNKIDIDLAKQYLKKKGYKEESIKKAIEELN